MKERTCHCYVDQRVEAKAVPAARSNQAKFKDKLTARAPLGDVRRVPSGGSPGRQGQGQSQGLRVDHPQNAALQATFNVSTRLIREESGEGRTLQQQQEQQQLRNDVQQLRCDADVCLCQPLPSQSQSAFSKSKNALTQQQQQNVQGEPKNIYY